MAKSAVKLISWVGWFLLLGLMVMLIVGGLAFMSTRHDLPWPAVKDYRPKLSSKIFAENGELIAELGVFSRLVVPYEEMPAIVSQAFVAAEDKNFYHHLGIDFFGILNAIKQSLTGQRRSLRGASTITQQLAKSMLIEKAGFAEGSARTISRKIKEAILAVRLEMNLSKPEILWLYLNDVYLGHGSYGVAAAAQNYFRCELKDLSLGQLAIIAGLPQAPTRFSPDTNLPAALIRQAYVLGRMKEDGYINDDDEQKALADNNKLVVFNRPGAFRQAAPYFSESVRRELSEKYGDKVLYEQGFTIYTSLDLDREKALQKALKDNLLKIDKRQGFLGPLWSANSEAERAHALEVIKQVNSDKSLALPADFLIASIERLDHEANQLIISTGFERGIISLNHMAWARLREPKNNYESSQFSHISKALKIGDLILVRRLPGDNGQFALEQEPSIEGAMIAIEPQSGYVVAMHGGYAFDKSEFNRIEQACRQPGSLFKPIVYSAAIALKHYTPATMLLDTPLTFRGGAGDKSWKPKNLGQKYAGEVTMREALMRSMNVPTLNIMADLGTKTVIDWAHRLGIKHELKEELGTAIGSSCVKPLEMAQVFQTIANFGVMMEPIMIKEIRDRDGQRRQFMASSTDPWIKREDRLTIAVAQFFGRQQRVMEQEDAYTMHYLLSETAREGTAQRTNILGRSIAGKTGTTNDSFDAWFAGYSKNLLALVWVGNDKMDQPLGVYEQGGRTALPVFTDFMDRALAGVPDESWPVPATMCEARIDSRTGLRIDEPHPLSFVAPFRCDLLPALLKDQPKQSLEQLQLTF